MHENVVVKKELNAPVEKVWQALTDKAQMNKWYFDIPDFELETHKEFNFYEPGDAQKYHHRCEILEIIPERKLKHTWTYPEHSKDKSIVKWELEEDGGKTMVTITGVFRPIVHEVSETDTRIIAHKSCALAAQTFMIAMAEQGYDTCPMEGFDSRRVKKILNLPFGAEVNMIVSCGIRDEKGVWGDRMRVDFEEVYKRL